MTLDAMMLALRPLHVGAVSLYASWKTGVGADIAVQEVGASAWIDVGRLGFEPLTTNGAYAQTGHPKALEILRTHLVPSLLLDLPDRSMTTIGYGWIFQVRADRTATFRRTALDPQSCGPDFLIDALAAVRTTHDAEVPLAVPDTAHGRLAQAALGICPAILKSLCRLARADTDHVPRIRTWPGAAMLLPDVRFPLSAQQPWVVRIF
jgi:hypothetical protein